MADLHSFAKNLFIVDGPSVRDMGFVFTTRMAVVKLSDGSLWVSSPVSVPFDTLKRITELARSDTFLPGPRGMSGDWQRGTPYFPKPSCGRPVPPRLP